MPEPNTQPKPVTIGITEATYHQLFPDATLSNDPGNDFLSRVSSDPEGVYQVARDAVLARGEVAVQHLPEGDIVKLERTVQAAGNVALDTAVETDRDTLTKILPPLEDAHDMPVRLAIYRKPTRLGDNRDQLYSLTVGETKVKRNSQDDALGGLPEDLLLGSSGSQIDRTDSRDTSS